MIGVVDLVKVQHCMLIEKQFENDLRALEMGCKTGTEFRDSLEQLKDARKKKYDNISMGRYA